MKNLIKVLNSLTNPINVNIQEAVENMVKTNNGYLTKVTVRGLTLFVTVREYNYKSPRFEVDILGYGLAYTANVIAATQLHLLLKLKHFLFYVYKDINYFEDIEVEQQHGISYQRLL